jgi:serine/threonine protein kinase
MKEKLSERKIASIVKQLLSSIAYLSYRYVMHRDIKLENILFDEHYNVKLTDFGCCVHSLANRRTVCGTIEYLCPEMIN